MRKTRSKAKPGDMRLKVAERLVALSMYLREPHTLAECRAYMRCAQRTLAKYMAAMSPPPVRLGYSRNAQWVAPANLATR